jgi:4'-phosphopantetheinyl transferase
LSRPGTCIENLSGLQVSDQEVHVLWLEVGDFEEPYAFARVLASDELARASQFFLERDRSRYLVAHSALRLVLAAYLDCPSGALRFLTGNNGKPALAGRPLEFNLSHSGDIVAIAVACAGRDVGIDVERMRPLPDMAGLLRHFATSAEAAVWHSLPADRRERAFYRLWTRKEAALKATGDGLLGAPGGFEAGSGEAMVQLVAGEDLWIRCLEARAGYAAALAGTGAPARLRSTRLVAGR